MLGDAFLFQRIASARPNERTHSSNIISIVKKMLFTAGWPHFCATFGLLSVRVEYSYLIRSLLHFLNRIGRMLMV